MTGGRMQNSIRNVMAGFINKVVALVCPFIIRTIIIKELGSGYVGLNGLFTSILSVLSISELGFGSAMVYSMYEPIANNNPQRVCALLNLYKQLYRYVGMFIMGVGLLLLPYLRYFIKGSYPGEVNIYILYLIFLFNASVSYVMFAYKGSLLSANQREDINSRLLTISNLFMYIIQIVVLLSVKDYYAYIIWLPITTVALNLCRSFVVDKLYPQYKCAGELEPSVKKEIFKNVGALVGHRISGTVILSADNIVISSFLGLAAVASYGNYYYVIQALIGFFFIIFDGIRPGIGNSIVQESVDKNYQDFIRISTVMFWLTAWCAICLLCLYQPFITIWVGEQFLLPMTTVVMLSIYFLVWKTLDVLIVYRDAAGMWWSNRFRPYVVAITNLAGNIALVKYFGLDGVVFTTFFTCTFISFPGVIHVLFREYFKRKPWKYLKRLSGLCVLAFLTGIVTYELTGVVRIPGFMGLLVKGAICLVFPNIIFVLTIGRLPEVRTIIRCILVRTK